MALNLNSVMLAGHLTRDPQVKSLANNHTVAEFGLAINRRFKGPDGDTKEESTFVDVEAWGRTAELVGQYLTKGSPCYLEGRLKLDAWQDKEGAKRSRLKVVADHVHFISNKKTTGPTHDDSNAVPPVVNRAKDSEEPYAAAPLVSSLVEQVPF